ncbi:hypothetical protein BJ322DRAFT_1112420 [Thelephora terrestris]|uniref:Uncharacterized protein n=1 Tax=Thelephora terrestris TaxID=56493 RepID=A0A9P6H696_9AGAM|nr:hypothetical protein BJ322DRAFT_1112420 [Thelephora terrestris]
MPHLLPATIYQSHTVPTSSHDIHTRTRQLMGDSIKGNTNEQESAPLRIDQKCLQDALRGFFQPIKNEDPRLDFYTMYKREATEYDIDHVKKYDEDLNTTLIFQTRPLFRDL